MFGRAVRDADHPKLLPVGRDPLSQALKETWPDWTVERVVEAAWQVTRQWDDYSLVGLAARIRDAVVLAALRESVLLYAEAFVGAALLRPVYEWRVDADLAAQARRFIAEFHRFVPGAIPDPSPENAARYYHAYEENDIVGRCVRIGTDGAGNNYHWGIRAQDGALVVEDFWSPELWTTARFRQQHGADIAQWLGQQVR